MDLFLMVGKGLNMLVQLQYLNDAIVTTFNTDCCVLKFQKNSPNELYLYFHSLAISVICLCGTCTEHTHLS